METRDRAFRAIVTAGGLALFAVLAVAAVRALIFVLDQPGWWMLVLAVALGGGVAQWVIDRPSPTSE